MLGQGADDADGDGGFFDAAFAAAVAALPPAALPSPDARMSPLAGMATWEPRAVRACVLQRLQVLREFPESNDLDAR